MARQGLGAMLLEHCTRAAARAGFKALELVSTMPGEPLYLRYGFTPLRTDRAAALGWRGGRAHPHAQGNQLRMFSRPSRPV
ncbi:GNAT family N-acetyltransferase [Massilia sp. H-1]|nr:GNAT family N-acetyltransferase [Massilia sp. H-1]